MKTGAIIGIAAGTLALSIGSFVAYKQLNPSVVLDGLKKDTVKQWRGWVAGNKVDYTYAKGQSLSGRAGLFNQYDFTVSYDETASVFTVEIKNKKGKAVVTKNY